MGGSVESEIRGSSRNQEFMSPKLGLIFNEKLKRHFYDKLCLYYLKLETYKEWRIMFSL